MPVTLWDDTAASFQKPPACSRGESSLSDEFLREAVERSQVGRAQEIDDKLVNAKSLKCCDPLTNCPGTAHQRAIFQLAPDISGDQSEGLFIAIGDAADGASRAMDSSVVTSYRLAMLLEHCQFMLDRLQISQHVAGIAILGDQFECHLLAASTNQDRNMRLLHALGLVDRAVYPVVFALEMGLWLLPHGMNDLERFTQHAQALRRTGKGIAIGPIFMLIPARANTKVQAAMAEDIEGTGHFGEQGRISIAIAGHNRAYAHAFCIARHGSQ